MADETEGQTVAELLNQLLGVYWMAAAQHQTHVALLDTWGITGLARNMQARILDEPVTIAALTNRLLDIGGIPTFAIPQPNIGTTLRGVLENDIAVQRGAPAGLNAAAEAASAAHDATTRVLIEGILAAEEDHLAWLETESNLLERLGEPLYLANRLSATPPTAV